MRRYSRSWQTSTASWRVAHSRGELADLPVRSGMAGASVPLTGAARRRHTDHRATSAAFVGADLGAAFLRRR